MSNRAVRTPVAILASAALALAIPATAVGAAQTSPAKHGTQQARNQAPERESYYDARAGSTKVELQRAAHSSKHQTAAVASLRGSLGVQGVVSIDPLTHTPRQVAKLDGYLTGPSNRSAAQVGLGYVRSHQGVFRLGPRTLSSFQLSRDYVDTLGTHHLSWQMMVRGVPVFGNGLRAHVSRTGRLIAVQGSPLAKVPHVSTGASVSASSARSTAARDVGGRVATARVSSKSSGPRGTTTWANDDRASRVVFMTPAGARLGWQTYTQTADGKAYTHVVDASTGRVLYRQDLTTSDNGEGLVYDNYPGAPRGGVPHRVNFHRKGWLLPSDDVLSGQFANVYSDVNDDDTEQATEEVPSPPHRAVFPLVPFQSSSLCDSRHLCTWDPAVARSWQTNRNQDGTQAFFFVSNFHDHLKKAPIGFTRAAGNFDAKDGDAVEVNTLDGADIDNGLPDANHIDNANMATPPDGTAPLMQMYLFHLPGLNDTDEPFVPTSGAEESDVVYHEYTHGLSNRLVVDANGNTGLTNQQAGSMGEAWSDWYAFDYLVDRGLVRDTGAAGQVLVGDYVAHGMFGPGLIRKQPIDCPVGSTSARCPGTSTAGPGGFTYDDFGKVTTSPEVHADGEIWGETLWDLRSKLGSRKTEMLVTRGMELSPVGPSYLDERNAILQADVVANQGRDLSTIWRVFAKRGMGWYAGSFGGGDKQPAADFHTPPSANTPLGTIKGKVTDALTGAGIPGAVVAIAGHEADVAGDYTATTNASGAYTMRHVVIGTYPKFALATPGYEFMVKPVTVTKGTTRVNFTTRRDWASGLDGARITDFNGPDYTAFGCGPSAAIDQSTGSGWGSDTGTGEPTGTIIPKFIVVQLPQAVNISTFEVDPSNACGDPGSSSTGDFRIETSTDGTTFTTAAQGTFTAANRGKLNVVTPAGGTSGVQYVKFWILGPQVPDFSTNCPDGPFGGCQFMDMSELEVFGTAAP